MMKSSVLGLRSCIVKVADLSAAKAWYAEAFQTGPYFDEPFYVGFDIGGFELGLDPNGFKASGRSNTTIYWGVEQIQKEFDRFLSLGATEIEAPHNVGGALMVATVSDPWGNLIGLIYNPDFKAK